ncbi:hypothetical protein CNR30_00705 [Levilactobacillus brevis]|nr:hypothetical protein BGC39_01440 [Levilactobacillus brevis]RDF15406.1 hypothetical protein CNR30_00705 [Levilactobacillus brevis]
MLVIHKRKKGICHLLHVPVWCTKYLLIKCIYIGGSLLKKIVLFSSILGVGLFLGSAGVVNVSANSTTSQISDNVNTSVGSNSDTDVDGSETNNDSSVQYNVGTVEDAIEEAQNSNESVYSDPSGIMLFSSAHLNSLAAYKKAGYKHITYSKWTGTHNFASTRASRMATWATEQLAGFIPGWQAKTVLGIYDAVQAFGSQKADVWPTYNLRLISATAPRGNRAIIGQESVVKYYSNSKRTHLKKTIHRTNWVG